MKHDSYEFILADEEFIGAAERLSAYCAELEAGAAQYEAILQEVAAEGLSSGETHEMLMIYLNYVRKLQEISTGIGEKFTRAVESFIGDVVAADDLLYPMLRPTVRDYSQQEYERLREVVDVNDGLDWFRKLIRSAYVLWNKIVSWFRPDTVRQELEECNSQIEALNDIVKEDLTRIFAAVHELDQKYGQNIPGVGGGENYYTCYFGRFWHVLCDVRDLLGKMAEIIAPGGFTPAGMQALRSLYSGMLADYENFIVVPERGAPVTMEQISDFVSQPWAESYFAGFHWPMALFIADLTDSKIEDVLKMTIFQMFEMANITMTHDKRYDQYLREKLLLDQLAELADIKITYLDDGAQEELQELKTILEAYHTYGEKFYEHLNSHRIGGDGRLILDGRTIPAKEFSKFLESLENTGIYLKYGDKILDYEARMLADYSKGLAYIESFERNYSGDSDMADAVRAVKDLYNKEFHVLLEEGAAVIKESTLEVAMEILKDTPVVAVLDKIEKAIDVTGEITGWGPEAKATYSALLRYNTLSATEEAYANAAERLRQADPNSENYATLVEDVENCFALQKKSVVETFNDMAKASDGAKGAYYRYCAKLAEKLTMADGTEPKVPNYDQFLLYYGD